MSVKVRFAPSPTGEMHVGNARVAIMNWLFARHSGGQFLLRMDDTDEARSTKAYEEGIMADLEWLGMDHDEFARQSDRYGRYDAGVEKLKADGRLYACYETPEELELKRKIQLGKGQAPVYDRAGFTLGDEERAKLEAEGRKPHWRFKLNDVAVEWDDLGRGSVHFEPGHLSDPVLIREDGRPLYTLSSVIDDGELGITHVIRGEDHVANTAVQVQLFEALGFAVPAFAHTPLMMGADGKGLSKRLGSLSLREMREAGTEPRAVMAYLAKLGTPHAPDGSETSADLARDFDIGAFGRSSPRYEPTELAALNAKVLHHLPLDEVQSRLGRLGLGTVSEEFWLAIRGNIEVISDALYWHDVCFGDIAPVADGEDRPFLNDAADLLPEGDWPQDVYKDWISKVKEASGRKGKQLFLPIRKALTGRDNGPELKDLLPLMGRERATERLKG
ncbi:glutamate--tRNA ligase [Aestuariispira insulae]|uniref:Glutamate--tRNA ligase n=1 Tax=Aestuariispira insulae TaxID=1461337 RepID=A0A3D9HX16_9PROT|nr:glutamate--tRNA ligase [Aestuariispira insulae]RED53931.1 glutamyl-tRNA synthetase [Aestuariispira insulae]